MILTPLKLAIPDSFIRDLETDFKAAFNDRIKDLEREGRERREKGGRRREMRLIECSPDFYPSSSSSLSSSLSPSFY
jgi:hypothetical protein